MNTVLLLITLQQTISTSGKTCRCELFLKGFAPKLLNKMARNGCYPEPIEGLGQPKYYVDQGFEKLLMTSGVTH